MKPDAFELERDKLKIALSKVAHGYKLDIVNEVMDVYGVKVVYQNKTSGVSCSLSPREGVGWAAIIGKLRDDSFPPHPIQIDDNTLLDRFNIRDIAAIRRDQLSPELAVKLDDYPFLYSPDDVAKLLRLCCGDVLQGDFSSFVEASAVVKQRAKQLKADFPRRNLN